MVSIYCPITVTFRVIYESFFAPTPRCHIFLTANPSFVVFMSNSCYSNFLPSLFQTRMSVDLIGNAIYVYVVYQPWLQVFCYQCFRGFLWRKSHVNNGKVRHRILDVNSHSLMKLIETTSGGVDTICIRYFMRHLLFLSIAKTTDEPIMQMLWNLPRKFLVCTRKNPLFWTELNTNPLFQDAQRFWSCFNLKVCYVLWIDCKAFVQKNLVIKGIEGAGTFNLIIRVSRASFCVISNCSFFSERKWEKRNNNPSVCERRKYPFISHFLGSHCSSRHTVRRICFAQIKTLVSNSEAIVLTLYV